MEQEEREKLEAESPFTAENREKKEMVSLGGIARTTGGKLTRSNYFRFIGHNLDMYDEIEMTPQEAHRVHMHISKLSTGSSAIVPLYCGGATHCPFASRCPLAQMGKAPLGKQCLLENQLLKEYIVRFMEEYDIDPGNFTEVSYINELAEIEVYLTRIKYSLSKPENAELVVDQAVGQARSGEPIFQKQISPFMDLKDRLEARKSKIVKLMVGDRQEKYKKEAALKRREDSDPSSAMAKLRTRLDALDRALAPTGQILSPQEVIDSDE